MSGKTKKQLRYGTTRCKRTYIRSPKIFILEAVKLAKVLRFSSTDEGNRQFPVEMFHNNYIFFKYESVP